MPAPSNIWEWSAGRIRAFAAELVTSGPAPIARLRIPSVDLDVMVLEGTDESVLSRAVGHVSGTAEPGDDGNVAIAGHRDGFFRVLRRIDRGDRVTLTTPSRSADYIVERTQIVDPSAIEVLEPSSSPSLTLITCYPFYFVGSAPQRFIVRATAAPKGPRSAIALQLAGMGPLTRF